MSLRYRNFLGDIIHVFVTARSDITFDVAELPKFSDNSYEFHYGYIKRVISYIRQDTDKGINWLIKDPVEGI